MCTAGAIEDPVLSVGNEIKARRKESGEQKERGSVRKG